MGEKIVVGPINKGLRTDRTPFVIDNDSFPTLINAYQWRGRIKRKRGTTLLGRLQRYFNSSSVSYSATSTITFDGSGKANLISGFSLQTNGSIVPGSVSIVASLGPVTYTDPTQDGYLTPTGSGGANTINYATGAILILAQAGQTATATFIYYPDLPVLGLEDLTLIPTEFPGTLAFDTTYAYNIVTANPYPIYDVSFYTNPATGTYPSYVQKTNWTPTTWNSQTYQQYWTVNYQGALWVTNGITAPFSTTNIGMQFKPIVAVTVTSGGPPAIVNLQITAHGLVVGDFLFINEVLTTTGINWQTGYVIAVVDANNVTVEFPNATIATNGTGGIAQYLTNRSSKTKDCIRFYDGDPTSGNPSTPVLTPGLGWINFAPPLSQGLFSIADLPQAQYYLVGCRMIVPFKDRLLFLGPVVQTSGGNTFYLQDTIIYSQNGTPYYTASFTGDPSLANTQFTEILVPPNQTASAAAYFEDQTGFGGFISAGVSQQITTCSSNEDVLIVGFDRLQTRVVYSGDDLTPFYFYIINAEYGSASVFSVINMDQGVLTRGSRGYTITSQTSCQRMDLDIPDQVFEINLTNNGNERFCAGRNFINEWVYFSYTSNEQTSVYPDQTLMFNYRDNSWAIFNESYTTYGSFRRQTGFIWSTIGMVYESWEEWNEPWDAGDSTLLQQELLAGNQQGFVIVRDVGTGEGYSLWIQSFSGSPTTVTSPSHNLSNGDYIIINGCLGTVGYSVNGEIFSVTAVTENTFQLNPDPGVGSDTYLGGGLITLMYVPFIQTKQFPTSWGMMRKTRLGPQQYLLSTTNNAQITLLIYLSQNGSSAYNNSPIVPDPTSINNSLVYSTALYTCPESTNLGLTPSNVNLQMPTAMQQSQIWHRINTSLIGDTIQVGFTISDAQMRDLYVSGSLYPITAITNDFPAVVTTTGIFQAGQLVQILGVVGMTELNGNYYQVISVNTVAGEVSLNVDSSAFTTYISGGTIQSVSGVNGFSEVELHAIILDATPSQMLA